MSEIPSVNPDRNSEATPQPELKENTEEIKLPNCLNEILYSPREREIATLDTGLLIQRLCFTGKEIYLLYDNYGNRIARGTGERLHSKFSIPTGGLIGFFQGEPAVHIHTHPAVLNKDENSLLNIVDLPSYSDLTDMELKGLVVIWGEEGIGFYASIIEPPTTGEAANRYRQAVEGYKRTTESFVERTEDKGAMDVEDMAELREIFVNQLGGKFYCLNEIDPSKWKLVRSKQAGMSDEQERLSSGLEVPTARSIYDQDGYRDRRYDFREMPPEEEMEVAKKFYCDINLHRQRQEQREKLFRETVIRRFQGKPQPEIISIIGELRQRIDDFNRRLADATTSSERTNASYEIRVAKIGLEALEFLLVPRKEKSE